MTDEDRYAGMTEGQKKRLAALEEIKLAVDNGQIDDAECARRLRELGATGEELEGLY